MFGIFTNLEFKTHWILRVCSCKKDVRRVCATSRPHIVCLSMLFVESLWIPLIKHVGKELPNNCLFPTFGFVQPCLHTEIAHPKSSCQNSVVHMLDLSKLDVSKQLDVPKNRLPTFAFKFEILYVQRCSKQLSHMSSSSWR